MVTALDDQDAILKMLLKGGKATLFGKEHKLEAVTDHASFIQAVPIREYEQFRPYVE